MSKHGGFDRLFLKKEFETIKGAKNRSILLLAAILLFTFLALGHVLGGFQKLKKSMNNPYTNWVNVGDDYETKIFGGNKRLQENLPELKTTFDIKSVKPYMRHYLTVYDANIESKQRFETRNVALDDPLYDIIVDPQNVIKSFDAAQDKCGLIVTEDMMNVLNASYNEGQPYCYTLYDTGKKNMVYPIAYIVNELPNDVDVVVTDLMMSLYDGGGFAGFYDVKKSRRVTFLTEDEKVIEQLSMLENVVSVDKEEEVNILGKKYLKIACFTNDSQHISDRDQFQIDVQESINVLPYQEYQCRDIKIEFDKDYYSYNFNSLDRIRDFKSHAKKFGVTVPIHQVEAKDNFVIVSKIAWTFILLLILFSSATVILFINNILKNHLEKIKPNLGTLKAFGLSEARINKLYLRIVLRFFIIAAFIALGLTVIYYFAMKTIFGVNFLFELWNPIFLILYGVILLIIIFFFSRMIKSILFKSPGDLIYNR